MGIRRYRAYIVALGIGLTMVAALWGGIAAIVSHNRDSLRVGAEVDATNVARVFSGHVGRTVTMIDLLLTDYIRWHREDPTAPWSEGLRTAYLQQGGVFQLSVVGADGILLYSSLAPVTAPLDLSDREHFRVHRDMTRGAAAANSIFISKPVLGRLSKRWSIQFTKRMTAADGGFAGVVVFSVGPEFFIEGFEAIDTGANGVTLLAGMDRIIRARFHRMDSETTGLGETLASEYPFFDSANPSGVTTALSVGGGAMVGGAFSHTAWRQVKDYPLVVAVQIADQDVLAEKGAVEGNIFIVGGGVTLVLLLGALVCGYLFTRQLDAQRQVERQAAELRIANEESERLAHVTTHHLQEPLRTIVSYTQLIEANHGSSLSVEGREWLGEVVGAATRMKQLLREMQLYLSEKALPRSTARINAGDVVEAVVMRLRPLIEEVGGSVEIGVLPQVIADQRRLSETVSVLLHNAIEYRAADRPLTIRVSGGRESGVEGLIAIADNGIGIEERYLERIFEVFTRLHRRDEHPGTGMGLAIARKMVERLGGRLTVHSERGVGSVFSIHLPADDSKADVLNTDDGSGEEAVGRA